MNFDRSLIFAYLEEDNIQRAYFRVRPLLTLEGDARQEASQLWPNEGGLRIVPDRNEQHTFKSRMRTLGAYCVVDLRNQPAEAGKIRTNKNFRPDRGEVNQYILYSDTVHELPENTFYQLMEGSASDYSALAEKSVTPLFFIRENDVVYGPVNKKAPALPEPAKEAAGMLYEIPCPDQVTRLILCMDDAAQTAAQPQTAADSVQHEVDALATTPEKQPDPVTDEPAAEVLPIGETLQILDQDKSHEDTIKQLDKPVSAGANLLHEKESAPVVPDALLPKEAPLTGTPLVQTPLHVSVQQNKNRTQEVVSNQWSVGKYEPPAQNLPAGVRLKAVDNPVESACSALKEAWYVVSAQDQLMDYALSLEGFRTKMEAKLCNGNSDTIMQRVLRQRLQDLEAERLTALCELDRARRDADAYKQEVITSFSGRISRETGKLESDRKSAEQMVASLKQEINALTLQRDAILARVNELQTNALPAAAAKLVADAQMTMPVAGIPLRMSPVSGENIDTDELIARLQKAFVDSDMNVDRNTAIALLVLTAICPRVGISCPTPAAVSTLLKNLSCAMGWQNSYAHQFSAEQHPMVGARPVDSTPAILTTNLPNYAPLAGVTKLLLGRSTGNIVRNAAYDVSQWPVLMLPALPFVPERSTPSAQPVSAASVAKITENSTVTTVEFEQALSPVLKAAIPLSGSARKEMQRFVSVCADLMEGGLPVAADWAILLWIVPALERGTKQYLAVKALLDEYPLSLAKM